MSKSRPKKVYEVCHEGTCVIVLGRHERGARAVAADYLKCRHSDGSVTQLPETMKNKALNRKTGKDEKQ